MGEGEISLLTISKRFYREKQCIWTNDMLIHRLSTHTKFFKLLGYMPLLHTKDIKYETNKPLLHEQYTLNSLPIRKNLLKKSFTRCNLK